MHIKSVVSKIPLLVRRGGCGINKNFGEAHLGAADGVVAHKPWFKKASSKWFVSDHPALAF